MNQPRNIRAEPASVPDRSGVLSTRARTGDGVGVGGRYRLRGTGRKAVLTLHIATALGLFGASVVLLVGGLHAATLDGPEDAHGIYSLLRVLTYSVDIPFAVLTLLAGLTLALSSKWGLFRYRWVIAKLALYLATVAIGIALIGPSLDTMLDVTQVSGPAENDTRWTLVALPGVQVALLLSAASLGVFKPGKPRPWRSARSRAANTDRARMRGQT